MIVKEEKIRKESLLQVANNMVIAARTAPKGRGIDNIEIAIVEGNDIKKISDKMIEIGGRPNTPGAFGRDAQNILGSEVIIILGTKLKSLGLSYCSLCGYENCEARENDGNKPCAFNTGDLGIAIGSAASIAMNMRVDNRIMYTVGMAVCELGLLGDDVKIAYGIPLSCTSKNPFFDRK